MNTQIINKNGQKIALVNSDVKIIIDTQSALDFLMTIRYETNSDRVALNKEAIADEFFVLSSGLAGEVLQKYINYKVKFAIYGDFSHYTSKPLKDFIYESNNGNDIFFVATTENAIEKLSYAK